MVSALRAACGLIVCGLLLAACAGGTGDGKPIVITPAVAAHLEEYQGQVDAGRSAAFAVNEAGDASFYAYCESGGCHGVYNFSSKAIQGCEKYGRGRCFILSVNGSAKRPYIVGNGSTSALPSQGVTTAFVSGDRIRQELVGNSIVEANFEGKIWAEYFAPDGTLRGRTDDGRPFDGSWKIEGDTLCVDYSSIARDWCGQFAEGADGSIDYYRDGKFRKTYPRSVLQKGNPQNL